MEHKIYCAVRQDKTDGHYWVDHSCASVDLMQCQQWAEENNLKVPHFYEKQPIVRFSQFDLIEVEVKEYV